MKIIYTLIATRKDFDRNLLSAVKNTWLTTIKEPHEYYFLFGDCDENKINNNDINLNVNEGVYNVGYKMIETFKLLKDMDFDYLVRTNLSSYVIHDNVINYLSDKPKHKYWSGFGVNHFSSGSFYVLSKDMIEIILKNENNWDHKKIDDVAISELLFSLGFLNDYRNAKRYDVNNKIHNFNIELLKDNYHCRYAIKDKDRVIDSYHIRKTHDLLINK